MKKIIKLNFVFALLITFTSLAQVHEPKEHKSIHKLKHLKINKIIYYEVPYITEFNKPIEEAYKPDWYKGYCATQFPLGLKDHKEAKSFIFPENLYSKEQLSNFYNLFKKQFELKKGSLFKKPYGYYFSDIYFTHKNTGKQYLMSFRYDKEKSLPKYDLSRMDTIKYKNAKELYKKGKINKSDINLNLNYVPTTISYYIYENGIYKSTDDVDVYLNVIHNGNSKLYSHGSQFDDFYKILRACPSYIRSRIENGERIFETVKYTPKGVKAIGKKRKKP